MGFEECLTSHFQVRLSFRTVRLCRICFGGQVVESFGETVVGLGAGGWPWFCCKEN